MDNQETSQNLQTTIHWNAEYIPHEPQPKQLAFLMLPHKEAFYGGAAGGGKCLTADHEVLTPAGWISIAEAKVGDRVLSWNDGRLSWENVAATHSYDYEGQMLSYEGRWSFFATPNHKWKARWETSNDKRIQSRACKWRWVEAAELRPNMKVPAGGDPVPPLTNKFTEDEAELLGWWLSEGSGFVGKLARISQVKKKTREQIIALIQRLGYRHKIYEREIRVEWKPPVCGTDCYDKFIPREYLHDASRLGLLRGLLGGDGYLRRAGWEYSSSSKQLAENVHELAVTLGLRATINLKKVNSDNPHWVIAAYPKREWTVSPEKHQLSWKAYKGKVYCITVPTTGVFFVRRNGGVHVTGNSDALLMAALQYVDIPGYSAILFRRTLSELKLAGALLDRAHSWLGGKRCSYVAGEHTYYFPTRSPWGGYGEPAKVAFGYMGIEGAKARYQSAEYQFVGFDELTHYPEADYVWMFSRIRKVTCSKHPGLYPDGPMKGSPMYVDGCPECDQKKMVPPRLRGASNPGNLGHKWVKERFKIEPVTRMIDGKPEVVYIGNHPERPFIPATVVDNQFIDQKAYIEALNELDPLTRAQMKKGDWGASLDARYKATWFANRRYHRRGDYYCLGERAVGFTRSNFLRVFTVIDPAASGREGPGDTDRYKKPSKSWTVITTFGLTDDYNLLILDMVRVYVEAPDIVRLAKNVFKAQKPSYIICEASGVGKAVYQALVRAGLPVKPVYPHTDKVMRSTDALLRAEKGQIWLPAHPGPAWLQPLEEELFTWIGHPYETDDIIDTIAYAATDVSWEAAGEERSTDPDLPEDVLSYDLTPVAFENPHLLNPGDPGGGADYYRGI